MPNIHINADIINIALNVLCGRNCTGTAHNVLRDFQYTHKFELLTLAHQKCVPLVLVLMCVLYILDIE